MNVAKIIFIISSYSKSTSTIIETNFLIAIFLLEASKKQVTIWTPLVWRGPYKKNPEI